MINPLSTPSSTACPVGVQFLPWKRGGSALRTSTTTHCEMLLWSREHRGSMAMYISSIDRRLRKTLRRCLAGAKKSLGSRAQSRLAVEKKECQVQRTTTHVSKYSATNARRGDEYRDNFRTVLFFNFSSKNHNGRQNFKIIKMVVLMYEIIKTVVLLLFSSRRSFQFY